MVIRSKKFVLFGFLLLIIFGLFFYFWKKDKNNLINIDTNNKIEWENDDRILILAPHPDDEIVGAGSVIIEAKKRGLPIRVIFLTNGDLNEWSFLVYKKSPVIRPNSVEKMGVLRSEEARKADRSLGLNDEELIFLGYPDGGCLRIWNNFWDYNSPYQSLLTRKKYVPYSDTYRPGALYVGQNIVEDLKKNIEDFKPTKIFVSSPADQNPDHSAMYLFTKIALWENDLSKIKLYPYLIHYSGWPGKDGDNYPFSEELVDSLKWQVVHITGLEKSKLVTALKKHESQIKARSKFLLAFIKNYQAFGDFETVDSNKSVNDQKNVKLMGKEERNIFIKDDNLIVDLSYKYPIALAARWKLDIYPYKKGEFEKMPKYHLELGILNDSMRDGKKVVSMDGILVKHNFGGLHLQIPLKYMQDAEKIIINSRIDFGKISIDNNMFRILDLNQ